MAAGYTEFEASRAAWVASTGLGRLIPKFSKATAVAEEKALAKFNRVVEAEQIVADCNAQRVALLATIRKEVWAMVGAQRQLIEDATGEALHRQLLQQMKRGKKTLRPFEKMALLKEALASYKEQVQTLWPEWVVDQTDPEQAGVEQRFGEVEFLIDDTAEGRALRGAWQQGRSKELLEKRAHGVSVSFDPALRVMIRPDGLGNIQVFGIGPVGPPNRPATVNIGVMNDGSIADVYREHPVPPLVAVQPAVKVNLNIR